MNPDLKRDDAVKLVRTNEHNIKEDPRDAWIATAHAALPEAVSTAKSASNNISGSSLYSLLPEILTHVLQTKPLQMSLFSLAFVSVKV